MLSPSYISQQIDDFGSIFTVTSGVAKTFWGWVTAHPQDQIEKEYSEKNDCSQ